MKLALIPPIDLLEYTEETNMQLMLPHLLKDERYEYVYGRHCKAEDEFVILDNGEAEGETIEWDSLWSLVREYRPDEFVLPDTIADADETMEKAQEFRRKFGNSLLWGPQVLFSIMFVIQGRTMEEFEACIRFAKKREWINVIGIPRHAIGTLGSPRARYDLALRANQLTDKPIHLLGASPLAPTELRDLKWWKLSQVRSTDTSMPFNYAYYDKVVRQGNNYSRPEEYFDLPMQSFSMDKVDQNVQLLMEWTGNDL